VGANKGGGQEFRKIMQTNPLPGSVGFVSTFVELFAWVLTMDGYEYLWELLCPSVNPYGWGYDLWYYNYASSRSPGFKMGIVSTVQVKHEQNLDVAGEGRTDSASVKEKWSGVLRQEAVYRDFHNIPLRKCQLQLKNSSLYGSVTSLLYDAPLAETPPVNEASAASRICGTTPRGDTRKRRKRIWAKDPGSQLT
jgi:hypothetical protein